MSAPRLLTTAVLGCAVVAAGCGGSDDEKAKAKTQPVPVARWAEDACTSAAAWVAGIDEAATGAAADAPADLAAVQSALVDLLEEGVDDTDTLLGKLTDAGVPDVPDGAVIARGLHVAFRNVSGAFARGRDGIRELATTDAIVFQAGAEAIRSAIHTATDDARRTLAELSTRQDSPELVAALRDEPACQGATGQP